MCLVNGVVGFTNHAEDFPQRCRLALMVPRAGGRHSGRAASSRQPLLNGDAGLEPFEMCCQVAVRLAEYSRQGAHEAICFGDLGAIRISEPIRESASVAEFSHLAARAARFWNRHEASPFVDRAPNAGLLRALGGHSAKASAMNRDRVHKPPIAHSSSVDGDGALAAISDSSLAIR